MADYRRSAQTNNISGTDADDITYWRNPTGKTITIIQSTVKIVPDVSVSQHASNTMLFELLNGSDVIADYDTTTTTGDGALTAGTVAAMTAGAAAGTALEVAAGGVLKWKGTNSGTGPAYKASCAFDYYENA